MYISNVTKAGPSPTVVVDVLEESPCPQEPIYKSLSSNLKSLTSSLPAAAVTQRHAVKPSRPAATEWSKRMISINTGYATKTGSKKAVSIQLYTGCVKIKRPNTKIAISQKCMNIFAPNVALLFNT